MAALFVRADSIYKTLPGVDAWDEAPDLARWLVELARRCARQTEQEAAC